MNDLEFVTEVQPPPSVANIRDLRISYHLPGVDYFSQLRRGDLTFQFFKFRSRHLRLSENSKKWPFFYLMRIQWLLFVSEKYPRLGAACYQLFQWKAQGIPHSKSDFPVYNKRSRGLKKLIEAMESCTGCTGSAHGPFLAEAMMASPHSWPGVVGEYSATSFLKDGGSAIEGKRSPYVRRA
jgi:hypothetical protein